MLEKIRISHAEIEDQDGQYGPQKRIKIKDQNGRIVSGWVADIKFKAEEWVIGRTIELEVAQNGKYWNFKLPNKQDQKLAAATSEIEAKVEAKHNESMAALRQIYALCKARFDAIEKVLSHLPKDEDELGPVKTILGAMPVSDADECPFP